MKKIFLFVMLISVAIILNGCVFNISGEKIDTSEAIFGATVFSKEEEIKITLNGQDTLFIPGEMEDITIKPWDKDFIHIKAYKKIKTNNRTRAEHYVDQIKIFSEKTEKQIQVYVDFGDELKILAQRYALLEISVPKSIEKFDVSSPSGTIDISDIKDAEEVEINGETGKISAHNIYVKKYSIGMGVGDVTAAHITGDGEISSTTGKMDISEINGDLKIITESGKCNIYKYEGSLNANIDKGLIRAEDIALREESSLKATTGDIEAELKDIDKESNTHFSSTSGRINIKIPQNAKFDVDAKATSGNVRINFSLNGQKLSFVSFLRNIFSSKTAVGKINGGGGKISAHTEKGIITIKKSP